MTNHLETTKEAYLKMMNNLLEERRDITKMYYEVKSKVDEIDKLLLAGDSGKVSNGQAAEIMKYAELFNNRPIVTEKAIKAGDSLKEKIKMTIPIEDITNEQIDKLREKFSPAPREKLNPPTAAEQLKEALNGFGKATAELKDLPKPRQATREELIVSSVEPVKEDKHILPVEPNKEDKRKGRRYGKVSASGKTISVHGQQGAEEMVKILQKNPRGLHVKDFLEKFNDELGMDIEYKYFASALSKAKKNDSRIVQAGRGFYIYQG